VGAPTFPCNLMLMAKQLGTWAPNNGGDGFGCHRH